MIERRYNGFELICDGCDESELFKGFEFHEVVEKIKHLGWKIVKDKDEWMHYCPKCKEGLK